MKLFLATVLIFVMGVQQSLADSREFSRLGKLAPFSDIAVIQRKYMPKTQRFEFFGGLEMVMNDAFYSTNGFDGRIGYHINELYGIEGIFMGFSSSERDVIKDLRSTYKINPEESVVIPKNFKGLAFQWIPMYGKITYQNRSIVPYDFYFSGGFGVTDTDKGNSEPTLHLGTGQNYALGKSTAFRWDLSLNYYNARVTRNTYSADRTTLLKSEEGTAKIYNLFLTLGFAYYFPEANYR